MTTSTRLGPDDAPYLKKGELKALVAKGIARVVPNKGNMVKVIRAKLKMSQAEFATAFRFSLRTVQQWEQGRYQPDQIARNYLNVIKTKPDMVRKALKRA
ncbi:MAG: helix-turn-helix domain-containing protein [Rhodospirillaceae bacterium]|nr:helix-turn-helix domain-containing protein [Rhodospirillaceae bacterium]